MWCILPGHWFLVFVFSPWRLQCCKRSILTLPQSPWNMSIFSSEKRDQTDRGNTGPEPLLAHMVTWWEWKRHPDATWLVQQWANGVQARFQPLFAWCLDIFSSNAFYKPLLPPSHTVGLSPNSSFASRLYLSPDSSYIFVWLIFLKHCLLSYNSPAQNTFISFPLPT